MRARQRHFNPAHAGAGGVYDSRYITFANGAEVDTWTSRTGSNSATQATSANRPLYRTNEINGNPAVEFDGSNDRLVTSSVATSSTSYTIYLFIRNDSTSGIRVYLHNGDSASNGYGFTRTDTGLRSVLTGGRGFNTFGATTTTWQLWTASQTSGTAPSAWVNGTSQTVSATSPLTVGTPTGSVMIGSDGSNPTDGMIASVIIFGSNLSASLRRRVEQSVAISFKHAIS